MSQDSSRSYPVLDDQSPASIPFGQCRYRAFGARTDISGIAPARQDPSFQNRTFDAGLGIYDYRNRSFDPATGRFLQRDPVMGGDELFNPYCFPGNNPVSRMDPMGLGLWDELVAMVKESVGGVVGVGAALGGREQWELAARSRVAAERYARGQGSVGEGLWPLAEDRLMRTPGVGHMYSGSRLATRMYEATSRHQASGKGAVRSAGFAFGEVIAPVIPVGRTANRAMDVVDAVKCDEDPFTVGILEGETATLALRDVVEIVLIVRGISNIPAGADPIPMARPVPASGQVPMARPVPAANAGAKPSMPARARTPGPQTKVVELPEKSTPAPVRPEDVHSRLESFLGPNPRRGVHPRTGAADPYRIVSADGKRSVRCGPHEMKSSNTNLHYHEETWIYDPVTDTMTYDNTIVKTPVQSSGGK